MPVPVNNAFNQSTAAPTSAPSSWGWNPLTDLVKATSTVGQWVDEHTHLGGLNPGIGAAVSTIANITPGLANLAWQGGKDIYHGATTGDWSPGAELGKAVGGAFEHGLLDTANDIASLGGLAPWSGATGAGIKNLTGYTPTTLYQYATRPGQGLLGGALNDVLNASLVADGATAIAKMGEVGGAAAAARIAEGAGQKEAIDAGAALEHVKAAGEASRVREIAKAAEEGAAKTGRDPAELAQAINDRAATLDRLEVAKKTLQLPIAPWRALSPLTKAAAESRAGEAAPLAQATEGLGATGELPHPTSPAEALKAHIAAATVTPGTSSMAAPETILHGNAPGQHGADVQTLAADMQKNGFDQTKPIEVYTQRDGTKVAYEGNNRLAAAKEAGIKEVPIVETQQYSTHGEMMDQTKAQVPKNVAAEPVRPESVPAAYKSYQRAANPSPEWAKAAIRHAPAPVVNLLALADDMRMRHDYQVIQRQSVRYTAVEARRIENTPEIQAMRQTAEQMVKDRVPGVTPNIASKIVGERVMAALVFGPMWEQLENLRPDLEAAQPGLTNHVLHFYQDLPPEYNTAEFRQQINQIAESIKPLRAQATEALQNSAFLGEKGLENIDSTQPILTRQEAKIYNQAEQLLKQAADKTERDLPNADALDKFKNTVLRMREQEAAAGRATGYIDSLEKVFDGHLQTTQTAIAALQDRAGAKLDQVAAGIENPSLSRTPTIFQPMVVAGRRMVEAVRQYPELEPILEGVPKTFGDALDFAEAHGWDPTYMPEMTPDRVRNLVNGTVRLGGTPGKEFTSGARQARTGALRLRDLNDQSIEGIIAGLNHAVQEDRTNLIVDWIDRVAAQDIPKDKFGRQTIPRNAVAWDEIRRGMLSTESPASGERVAVGATKMIPRAVADAIKEYSQPNNPLYRALKKMTDPWRALMLTLNPAFYVKHFSGHVLLAVANEGGFRLSDWTNAYRQARQGFMEIPEVTGQNITMSEIGTPGIVKYGSVRDAWAQGGPRAASNHVAEQLHKVIGVGDSFARAVVYFSDVRKGADPMVAMQHAMDALVDYGDLSSTERYIIRSIIPFYGFHKGVLKTAVKLPFDHPLVTAVMMKVGEWQGDQAVDSQGNPLPEAYQGVVNIAGHNVNLGRFSPFKDLGSLTTPDGIVSGLQFAIQAVVRSGLGVAAPFTKSGTKVNKYGQVVPDVPLGGQLLSSLTNSPIGGFANAMAGQPGTKTPGQAVASFLGVPITSQETLDKAGARNVVSQGEVANADAATQQRAVSAPVDTQLLQQSLRSKINQGEAVNLPTSPTGGQMFSQAQLQAAVQQAVDAQQARAAVTRAAHGSSRRGGGSHRSARHSARARYKLRQGFGKKAKRFGR